MYKIKYWFEHGGHCLWSSNDLTREKYGYAIKIDLLNLRHETTERINALTQRYHTFLNWSDPSSPSQWSEQEKSDFLASANELYAMIVVDLGDEFDVTNEAALSVL